MKWLPRSLFGRNLLTLVLLIVLGQGIAGLIFHLRVLQPRTEQYADSVVASVTALRDALQALPPPMRARAVAAFNARQEQEANLRAVDQPPRVAMLPALERLLVRQTSAALAERGLEATWRHDGPDRLYLRLEMDGDAHWVFTPILRAGLALPRTALLIWALAVALGVVGAYVLQRRLSRPLNALVDAAEHLGRGEPPPALREDGPTEIAALGAAFNRMAGELARQEQERTVMLAGVSHDLRTPLAKMRLAVEMLDGADAELCASLVGSCRRMDAIIDQFTDFLRNGDSAEPVVSCDLPAMLRQCAAGQTPAPTLELPEHLELPLRPRAFARLVDNLLTNARLYGHAAGEVAQVTLRCARLADGRVEVAVEDRGPGIPIERAEALQQPFVRGDDARGGPPGTGLGLAIAARIARLHRAPLELLPRPGGGLCARVCLPG